MWSGVALPKSLPKPFVVRSIRIGGTKPSSRVPSASLSLPRHIGQRLPPCNIVSYTPCLLVPHALHRAFAVHASHVLYPLPTVRIPSHR